MNVGDTVTWNSKIGPVDAEYRGKSRGLDGMVATIIVREPGGCPFQISVPVEQIAEKAKRQ